MKGKDKTTSIEGVEFRLPFKMSKKRFTSIYGKRFGDRTEAHYETLTKKK